MLLVSSLQDPILIQALHASAVGALPTDTIYGLACRAEDQDAVKQLYISKPREAKPGTVIAASIDQLVTLGIPRRYLVSVAHFWPNPLSIIVPTTPELSYLDRGLMSLAVRVPADDEIRQFLEQTGPLLTTSANMPDQPPATTIEEAKAYFGDKLDFYVDGGVLHDRPASTIIRVIDDEIEVVRRGAVQFDEKGQIVT